MGYERTSRRRTGLHCDGAHVSIISVVTVWVMQADIDAEIDLVILRVPPAGVDDLVGIRCSVHGAIRDAVVHAIMTVVVDPIAEAVRPISALPCVANPRLRWRDTGRRGDRTILAGLIAGERKHDVVVGIVWCGMIEDGFLGSSARIGRVKKRCDRLLRRERMFRRGATHAEEKSTEQESCQNILNGVRHSFSLRDSRK